MGAIIAIARNTLMETVRQPVYGLALTLACVIVLCTPYMSGHVYVFNAGSGLAAPAERMIADIGLSTVLLMGLILGIHATAGVVSREIENKTALSVLSKRVGRWAFILGKYFGVALALLFACAAGVVFVLMTVRTGVAVAVSDPIDWWALGTMISVLVFAALYATFRNYYRGRAWVGAYTMAFIALTLAVFAVFSTFDRNYRPIFLPRAEYEPDDPNRYEKEQRAGRTFDWEVAKAGLLTAEAVLLMAAVAIAASSRLSAGGNLAVCGVMFVAGLTSEFFRGEMRRWTAELPASWTLWGDGADRVTFVDALYNIYYALAPNLQHIWMSDALTREQPIPWAYVAVNATPYVACYIAAALCAACFLFERRDIA